MKIIIPADYAGERVLATIVDYGLYYGIFYLLLYTIDEPTETGGYKITGLTAFLPVLLWICYFPVAEGFGGQTLGHALIGLQVVDVYGHNISLGAAFKRRICDPIDLLSFFGLVGFLTVKYSERHQRVGDMVANTIVVGSENVACQYCGELLKLTPRESISRRFTCPECNKRTDMNADLDGV